MTRDATKAYFSICPFVLTLVSKRSFTDFLQMLNYYYLVFSIIIFEQ